MKKALGQTVRDLKREVNKKVLKVPGIEQKVLDATSNEPWGPHGSLLADIAQASRNYHEYQMIMGVIWKRINDTGKNWRHVYKALTVLEYLVANGSERVIDEIKERVYQVSTLSDFQYIDSGGRDQGSNVRKKSQSLVVLVNDKERIIEARQKASVNRDKFRNTSMGGMYKPSSHSGTGGYGDRYDDDRNGGRDDDRDGYGRERDYNYRDDDKYGRYGDSNSRDGDRYGRDYDERYGRDGYRDDDHRERSRSVDDHHYGSRSRSSDRDGAIEDDGQSSSRGSGARADDQSQGKLERKFSEQNIGAPPSYEEATGESPSPAYGERNGDSLAASAPGASSPTVDENVQANAGVGVSVATLSKEVDSFNEFDPRGAVPAGPTASTSNPAAAYNQEIDLLGSLSDSYSSNLLAIMPASSEAATSQPNGNENFVSGPTQPASTASGQPFEDPFGDSPFKATPFGQQQIPASTAPFQATLDQNAELHQPFAPNAGGPVDNSDFGNSFSSPSPQFPSTTSQFLPQQTDILADILPPLAPPPTVVASEGINSTPSNFQQQGGYTVPSFGGYMAPPPPTVVASEGITSTPGNFQQQGGYTVPSFGGYMAPPQASSGLTTHLTGGSYGFQGPSTPGASYIPPQQGHFAQQTGHHALGGPPPQFNNGNFATQQAGPAVHYNNDVLGNLYSQGPSPTTTSQQALARIPQSKDKFETKSAVWNDTLSRGLVNLNISGAKTNPLSDIGIDFDAINRKDRRMEKPSATPVTNTITMGKAMGFGTGMGRAGAGALRPPANPMVSSGTGMGMGMGMGGGPGAGFTMGGYGGINQPAGMGMGVNMNLGMGQGAQMQQQNGYPGSAPVGYRPMMGGYPQQPYGRGY